MSKIINNREAVEKTPRKSITPAKKRRIRKDRGNECLLCGLTMWTGEPDAPEMLTKTDFDHFIPLALGGEDNEKNIYEICSDPCHKDKTKRDKSNIARAIRREKVQKTGRGRKRKGQPIKGQGFPGHRKFNGQIVWKDKS